MRSSPDRAIDLNADVGEGAGEEPLYGLISSANIACGGHAGDEATMKEAVRLAQRHVVAIGAHPSYPDRANFGRITVDLPPSELSRSIAAQIEALLSIAGQLGARIAHVKPHGALYNDAAREREVAVAVADGVASVSRELVLVGLAGSSALAVWRERGFRVASEGFADRAYGTDGQLVPRAGAGALITDATAAAVQAVRLADEAGCDTICVHSDTPGAANILTAVRGALLGAGFSLRARSRD
jgi:UPF0271 protein